MLEAVSAFTHHTQWIWKLVQLRTLVSATIRDQQQNTSSRLPDMSFLYLAGTNKQAIQYSTAVARQTML